MFVNFVHRLEDAVERNQVEVADGAAHLCAGVRLHDVRLAQSEHLVADGGEVGADAVVQVAHTVAPSQREFDTCVAHLAVVGPYGAYTRCPCLWLVEQQVGGLGCEPFEGTEQAVAEHVEVETYVGRCLRLPTKVDVHHRALRGTVQHRLVLRRTEDGIEALVGPRVVDAGNVAVVAERLHVAHLTPAGADLQVVDILLGRLEEFLFRDTPSQRERGEVATTVVRTELRAAVRTEVELCEILAVVAIVDTSQVGELAAFLLRTRHAVLVGGKVYLYKARHLLIVADGFEPVPVDVFCRMSGQHRQMVLAEGVLIRQRVVQYGGDALVAVVVECVGEVRLDGVHADGVAVVEVLVAAKPSVYTEVELVGEVLEERQLGIDIAQHAVVHRVVLIALLLADGVRRVSQEIAVAIAEATAVRAFVGIVHRDDGGHGQRIPEARARRLVAHGVLERQVLANLEDAVGGICIHAGRETLVFRAVDDTRLVEEPTSDGHIHLVRALRVHYIIVLGEACLELRLLPVGLVDILLLHLFRVVGGRPVLAGIEISLLVVAHEVGGRHHVDLPRHVRDAPRGGGVECRLTLLAAFCRDENDAIGTACTIDGGSRSILQHLHRFYLVGVDMVHVVHNQTVDDIQRAYGVERADTTYLHLTHDAGLTGCRDRDAWHLSLQHLIDIGRSCLVGLLHVDYTDGTCQVGLLLNAITDDDNIFERLYVAFHLYVDARPAASGYHLVDIADIAEEQPFLTTCRHGVVSVEVGNGHTSAFERLYGYANERLTILSVGHRARYILCQ